MTLDKFTDFVVYYYYYFFTNNTNVNFRIALTQIILK